jgi:hypothetical protein
VPLAPVELHAASASNARRSATPSWPTDADECDRLVSDGTYCVKIRSPINKCVRPRKKIYERALVIELRKRGHHVEPQNRYRVFYDDQRVGTVVPDMIVDNLVIVDTKVATAFIDSHSAKMIGHFDDRRSPGRPALELQIRGAGLDESRSLKPAKQMKPHPHILNLV